MLTELNESSTTSGPGRGHKKDHTRKGKGHRKDKKHRNNGMLIIKYSSSMC